MLDSDSNPNNPKTQDSTSTFPHRTHGMSRTAIYRRWADMLTRARNPNYKQAKDYSERGISVCERWLSFENFYADMGDPPTGYSIERKNNDLGYSPENCHWAPKKAQARNTRTTKLLTVGDETYCQAEWAERVGVTPYQIYKRIKDGWTPEEVAGYKPRTRTTGARTKWLTANGITLPQSEWARRTGIKKSALRGRLKRGWTPEEALGLSKS